MYMCTYIQLNTAELAITNMNTLWEKSQNKQ